MKRRLVTHASRIGAGILLSIMWTPPISGAELFELSNVRLADGPFKHAQDLNREHLLQYEPDRLLAPFLAEAGLPAKARKYPSWESSGLDGHTAGHYLSALANTYAATGDPECLRRLTYMVSELARCQQTNGDGYVGGIPEGKQVWEEIAAGDIRASGFALNDRWVPWYNLHKTLAGLRDAWLLAGNEEARDVLVQLADWCGRLVAGLSDEQMQEMLEAEHGGMNEVLADVAAITGDDRHLALARRFSHRAILDPLARGEDRLNGLHANTQVPKVVGFQRIAALAGEERYHRAAAFFWDTVTSTRTLAFGGNSIAEHFPAPEQSMEWIQRRQGPETCNTYNMLRLTEQLFEAKPNAAYADFYERAVLNHILSSHHSSHGGYVYFTPARPRHYRVYSQPGQAFWCCVGSGMENHGRYGQFIYARSDDDLFVNLFIASRLNWVEPGLQVVQETRFPDEPRTRLVISADRPVRLALHVRHPAWVAQEAFQVTLNGERVETGSSPSSYATIEREWQDGDVVEVELPMRITTEPLPYLSDYVALMYGPVMLAAPTGTEDMPDLLAGTERWDHIANGPLRPLEEAPMLVAEADALARLIRPVAGEPLTFTAARAIEPDTYDELKLIPFFRLHDARYMMYWRRVRPDEYARVMGEIKAAEEERLRLDRATVDQVTPGQQQPESDHNIQGEETTTGIFRDRHFRHAEGWFSYDLQAGAHENLDLMVTCFGSDRRSFDILINGKLLESVRLEAPEPGRFIDVRYPIPPNMIESARDGVLTVRFAARPGSMAGGIYDVRLVKRDE